MSTHTYSCVDSTLLDDFNAVINRYFYAVSPDARGIVVFLGFEWFSA